MFKIRSLRFSVVHTPFLLINIYRNLVDIYKYQFETTLINSLKQVVIIKFYLIRYQSQLYNIRIALK